MYEREVIHEGLNKYRMIRGSDYFVVEQKAIMQERDWEEQWQKKLMRENAAKSIEDCKQLAQLRTSEAEMLFESIDNILLSHLESNQPIVNWNQMKARKRFTKKRPQKELPNKEGHRTIPIEPLDTDSRYKPVFGLLGYIVPSIKQKRIDAAREKFEFEHLAWEQERARIIAINRDIDKKNQEVEEQYLIEFDKKMKIWRSERKKFFDKQKEFNHSIDLRKNAYLTGSQEGIIDFLNIITEFDAEAVRDLHAVKGRTAIWTEKNKTMLVLQSMVLLFFLPVIADHSVHYIDWLSLKKGPQIIHSNVHQTLAAFLWRPGNMRRNDTILRF